MIKTKGSPHRLSLRKYNRAREVVAYNIRFFLDSLELDNNGVARLLGVSPGLVTRLKRGRTLPHTHTLLKLCEAIPGCTIADLLEGVD